MDKATYGAAPILPIKESAQPWHAGAALQKLRASQRHFWIGLRHG
jgi:hypothetical protein